MKHVWYLGAGLLAIGVLFALSAVAYYLPVLFVTLAVTAGAYVIGWLIVGDFKDHRARKQKFRGSRNG